MQDQTGIAHLPSIRMSSASVQIYQAFRDKAEAALHEILTKKLPSVRIPIETHEDQDGPQDPCILTIMRLLQFTEDGRCDDEFVEIALELNFRNILVFTSTNIYIKTPSAFGYTIVQKAEGFDSSASQDLLHQLVEMPEAMTKNIRPRIEYWQYSEQSGMLRAAYADSYRMTRFMPHSRLFTTPAHAT